MKAVWRDFAAAVLTLLAVSLITFLLFPLAPGDYATSEGFATTARNQTVEAWRQLDRGAGKSPVENWLLWLGSCSRGECGVSLAWHVPTLPLIARRLPETLMVWLPAWFVGAVAAVLAAAMSPAGVLRFLEPVVAALSGVPEILIASLAVWLAAFQDLRIDSPLLIGMCVAIPVFCTFFLHTASAALDTRRQLWYELAASRPLPPFRLWFWYLLPGCLTPVPGLFGPSLLTAAGATLIAEAVIGRPGVGSLFLDAVQARDFPIVQTMIMLLSATLAAGNLAAEVVRRYVEQRTGSELP